MNRDWAKEPDQKPIPKEMPKRKPGTLMGCPACLFTGWICPGAGQGAVPCECRKAVARA